MTIDIEKASEPQRACPCACCNFRDEIDIVLKEGEGQRERY